MFLVKKKKLFFSNNCWSPPLAPVLCIFHFNFLLRRLPARSFTFLTLVLYPVKFPYPVLHISHSGSLTRSRPAGPSHFPLQFFNLSVPILENPTWTKESLVPFISTTLSSWWFSWKNCHFVGRFFDFVIILRPITMYQDYLNCPWPLSVRLQGKLFFSFNIDKTWSPRHAPLLCPTRPCWPTFI